MSDNEDNDAPVEKKAKRKTVDWKSRSGISIMKSLFTNVMAKKPWVEKNSGASYNALATVATRNLENYLDGAVISGDTYKKVITDQVALFHDKFFDNPATNFSGNDGDRDEESNYTELELLVKPVHAAINGIKVKAASSLKEKEADLKKVKAKLEQSALCLANKNQKRGVDGEDNDEEGKPLKQVLNTPIVKGEEDPIAGFMKCYAEKQTETSKLKEARFDEEKRMNGVKESIEERMMKLKEEEQLHKRRQLDFEIRQFEAQQNNK